MWLETLSIMLRWSHPEKLHHGLVCDGSTSHKASPLLFMECPLCAKPMQHTGDKEMNDTWSQPGERGTHKSSCHANTREQGRGGQPAQVWDTRGEPGEWTVLFKGQHLLGCTTMGMYLMPLTSALNQWSRSQLLCYVYFTKKVYIVYEYVIHILMVNIFLGGLQPRGGILTLVVQMKKWRPRVGEQPRPLPQVCLMEVESYPRLDSLASSPFCCKDTEQNRIA